MDETKIIHLEIVTPEKVQYKNTVYSVTVPGTKSPFQVLYDHAPIVSSLETGITKILDTDEKELFFATSPGFVEVLHNKVSILVDNAEEASELNPQEIEERIKENKRRLKDPEFLKESETLKFQIQLDQNRLKAKEKLSS